MAAQLVLLFSKLSTMSPSASARPMMYQVPGAVPAGIVTEVVPMLIAPGGNAGTERPPRGTSPACVDR